MRLSQLTLRVFALCAALFCNRAAHADETVASSPAQDSGKVELRLRLQKGQIYDQVVAIQQKTSQTIQGHKIDDDTTMRFDIHSEVLDVQNDGPMRVRMTYRRVQLLENASNKNHEEERKTALRYDSAHPPKTLPPAAVGAAGIVGQSLIITMTPSGKVLKTEGIEKLVEHIITIAKLPPSIRAEMKKQFKPVISKQMHNIMGGVSSFPVQSIGIGDKWQSDMSDSTTMPVAVNAEYFVLARNNGAMHLGVIAKILPNEKASVQTLFGTTTKFSLSGMQTGTYDVNEKSGWTQSVEIHHRASGKISSTKIGETQKWPIYISSTIRGWTVSPVKP